MSRAENRSAVLMILISSILLHSPVTHASSWETKYAIVSRAKVHSETTVRNRERGFLGELAGASIVFFPLAKLDTASILGSTVVSILAVLGSQLGDALGDSPRIVDAQIREVSRDAINTTLPEAQNCLESQEQTLDHLKEQLLEKKIEIDFFVVEPASYSGFRSKTRDFAIRRPNWGMHLIEELGTRRAKHYKDFPAPAVKITDGGTLAIGVYLYPGKKISTCVTATEKEILAAIP